MKRWSGSDDPLTLKFVMGWVFMVMRQARVFWPDISKRTDSVEWFEGEIRYDTQLGEGG